MGLFIRPKEKIQRDTSIFTYVYKFKKRKKNKVLSLV